MIMRSSLPDLPIDSRFSACYLKMAGWRLRPPVIARVRARYQENGITEVFEEVDPEVQMLGSNPRSCGDSAALAGRNPAA